VLNSGKIQIFSSEEDQVSQPLDQPGKPSKSFSLRGQLTGKAMGEQISLPIAHPEFS